VVGGRDAGAYRADDANGQSLGYFYFRNDDNVVRQAGVPTRDEEWRTGMSLPSHGTVPTTWSRGEVGGPKTLGARQTLILATAIFQRPGTPSV
jgi:hypothetical protein